MGSLDVCLVRPFRNKGASQGTTKSHTFVFSAPTITEKISLAVMFVNDQSDEVVRHDALHALILGR
jgi:hypothetical protein